LLVGGNNVGKSTVCEALDLVLGQNACIVGQSLMNMTSVWVNISKLMEAHAKFASMLC